MPVRDEAPARRLGRSVAEIERGPAGRACLRPGKPRYGRLTDVEQCGDGALRVAGVELPQCLGLLVRGEGGLATELDAPRLGLGSPCGCALSNPRAFPARRDPQHCDNHLGELRRGIDHRLGDRAEARANLLYRMEDVQQVAGVAGKPVGRRHHQHVAGIERADRPPELGPLGRRAADLLAIDFGASRRFKLGELLGQILAGARDAGVTVNHRQNRASDLCIREGAGFAGFPI